jgi:ketosteroid isomerase-like protein
MTTDVTELVDQVERAAVAYISGDLATYLKLISHADDYTLMSPFGGPTVHGIDVSEENIETTRRFFAEGEATLEVEQTYVSSEMAVLVAVERQHGVVGGLPDQDWSLRVTLVFRREGEEWKLVHRHADSLVHPISMRQLSKLASGDTLA